MTRRSPSTGTSTASHARWCSRSRLITAPPPTASSSRAAATRRSTCWCGHSAGPAADRFSFARPVSACTGFQPKCKARESTTVPLAADFGLDAEALIRCWTPAVKVVFLCSPNNPTGNALDADAVERVLAALDGRAVVAIDEAYVEFSRGRSFLGALARRPGLVILRTLSKAHGLASSRCGVAIGAPGLIELLGRIMPPYALPGPTVVAALAALDPQRVERTHTGTHPHARRRARPHARGARDRGQRAANLAERRKFPAGRVRRTPRARLRPPRVAACCCATSRASRGLRAACASRSAAARRTTACSRRWGRHEPTPPRRSSSTATAP